MKLDKDLVREVLLQVEASPDPMGWVDITVDGHSEEEIAYHVQILDEAGFLEAEELTSLDGYDWRANLSDNIGPCREGKRRKGQRTDDAGRRSAAFLSCGKPAPLYL